MKYDIITIGGATEDITFYTSEGVLIDNKKDILRQKLLAFEYGAKIKIDKAHSTFGGGAANTAVSFSRLGFRAASLIAVGQDIRGKKIIKNLEKQKVNTGLVQKIKDNVSGFSFILVGPNNEHIVFSHRAANSNLRFPFGLSSRRRQISDLRFIKKTKWVYITSLSGQWQDVLKRIFSVKGVKIAWNPGYVQLNKGKSILGKYFKKTEILIVNKDEAIELVISDKKFRSKPFSFYNNIKNLLTIIKSWGPQIVVITSGKNGADAYDSKKYYHATIAKEQKRIDTTGVGDAFGSSFIAGLELYNGNIKKAMKLGTKNTASVISQQGAQNGLLTKKDI